MGNIPKGRVDRRTSTSNSESVGSILARVSEQARVTVHMREREKALEDKTGQLVKAIEARKKRMASFENVLKVIALLALTAVAVVSVQNSSN